MKTGSMDERRLLADVRSGREALQEVAASLKVLVERSEPRSAVEARLEVVFGVILAAGVPASILSGAVQHVGIARTGHLGLTAEQAEDAATLAVAAASYEVLR